MNGRAGGFKALVGSWKSRLEVSSDGRKNVRTATELRTQPTKDTLSPEERVSASGSPEGSLIADFVAEANRSSGTLMFDLQLRTPNI
jgi:hypothetical protein